MKIKIAQLSISQNIATNASKIIDVINSSNQQEWIIFPECMLSGMEMENPDFVKGLNFDLIDDSVEEIKRAVVENKCNLIFGSIMKKGGDYYDSAIFINSDGDKKTYDKANLSPLYRKQLKPGGALDVIKNKDLIFGVQMCRDNAFPEQWKVLKNKGAKIIFHLNNAVREDDLIRKHLLISQAFENQVFVCSVNTITDDGPLSSLLVSPFGEVLYEAPLHKEDISSHEIDLDEVSNTYLRQERTDLVDLRY